MFMDAQNIFADLAKRFVPAGADHCSETWKRRAVERRKPLAGRQALARR
jgi:hypothetical protein